MTYASTTLDSLIDVTGFGPALRRLKDRVALARRRDQTYRQTFDALSQMSDRDLADIGIARFMIADVAAEAAARV